MERELSERLASLETLVKANAQIRDEQYNAHTRLAAERQEHICNKFDTLFKHLDSQTERKDKCMAESKGYTNRVVAWVVGAYSVVITVLLVFLRYGKG